MAERRRAETSAGEQAVELDGTPEAGQVDLDGAPEAGQEQLALTDGPSEGGDEQQPEADPTVDDAGQIAAGHEQRTSQGAQTDRPAELQRTTTAEGDAALTRPGLLDVPVPPVPIPHLDPVQLEPYILAGIHRDLKPGNVLVVLHPAKLYKVPEGLFEDLERAGFGITIQETARDTLASVQAIRDRLLELHAQSPPLDVIVMGGDGTLDQHFLTAAYVAFYPELVRSVPGRMDASGVGREHLERVPERLRDGFALHEQLPEVEPTEENIRTVWLLRSRLQRIKPSKATVRRVLRAVEREPDDPLLRHALLATYCPEAVTLLPDHFDLSGLAEASQADTFRGLYPFLRCVVSYPAGTAADHAVFAGVPGWIYGLAAKWLRRLSWLRPLQRRLGRRARRAFLDYFASSGTVVPARLSVTRVDGHWHRLASHAVGGPASGHFFSGDLTRKAKTVTGYLMRTPKVIYGAFSSPVVEVESLDASKRRKSWVRGLLAEGLYTNRTFIGGVGSLPTTTPTSFGGESSLVVVPPMVYRDPDTRRWKVTLRPLLTFGEAIAKGVLARAMHLVGLNPGRLAGEGKLFCLQPQYQVAIQEGEEISIRYLDDAGQPRAVAAQISGDPIQACDLGIKVLWGPIPLLAARRSLLLESTRRTLNHLRLQQSYRLERAYIGGVHHFRHTAGPLDRESAPGVTGLANPPVYLPLSLKWAQTRLLESWRELGTGEFVDTSAPGLGRRGGGLCCHNNDHSAHLLVLREGRSALLVRQVRRGGPAGLDVFETRTRYRRKLGSFAIDQSQTIQHPAEGPPLILMEERYFRDAEEFQQMAPTYFPLLAGSPDSPVLNPLGDASESDDGG